MKNIFVIPFKRLLHYQSKTACYYFTLIGLLVAVSANAQDIKVSGKVTGQNNEPLGGVSVTVQGANAGTATNNSGAFSLTVPSNATLAFSYIGYADTTIAVNGQTTINVRLTPSQKQLEQVVVIGYGTQKRKDITSAISTVRTEDISTRPTVNTAEVLAGKASGVQVVQPSGRPGSDFSVNIRGIASPNGNQPLYVIDGVMAYSTQGLDPQNIESISILKDAAAAGIYGAAGSTSGVVLITTKKGTKGKSQVQVNAYSGVQKIVKKLDVLNSQELAQLLVEEKRNSGDEVFTVDSSLLGVNNNWQDIVYRTAPITGVNVGFSGGSPNGTYYLGVGYLSQQGIIILSDYVRYSVNLNVEQNLNKWLSAGTNFSYNRTNSRDVPDNARVNQGGVVLGALNTPPFVPKYNADNTFGLNPFQAWENPLASIEGPYNKTIGNNIVGNVHAEIKLPFNLKYRSQFGITLYNSNYDYFLDPYRTQYGRSKGGIGQNNTSETFRWIWDNTLTFDKRFGAHSVNFVLGTSSSDQEETSTSEYGEGFPSGSVMTLNFASANKSLSTYKQGWSLASYFARLQYSYRDRYLATASIRRDGSSRFGPQNQWGYFPAFSVGWRVSQEDFMKNITFINDLKFRAGWGVTGNIPPVYYPAVSQLSGGFNYSFAGNVLPGVAPSQEIGNPNLKWEQGQQLNVGFDVTVVNNRVSLSADYYRKRTTNLIYQQNVPMSTGLGYRYANVPGTVQNTGFEFSLNGTIFSSRNFKWTSTLNMSFNKNVVKNLDSTNIIYGGFIPERDFTTIVKNGLPLGAFYGYVAEGVDPGTGEMIFRDINNDGIVDANDRTYLGSPLPRFNYGFVNDFTFGDFGLYVLIDGVSGNKVFNATRIETEGMFQVNNQTTTVLNRWEKAGDITSVPKAEFADPNQNTRISSRFIESGSFLRFRDITLSYNFNKNLLQRISMNTIRLYVTLQNWFIITKYKGYQPEVNAEGASTIAQGIDYGTYPQAKTVTVGLNITF